VITVNAVSRGNPCGEQPMVLTGSSGTITSPGYDQQSYPNEAMCQWLITAPAGNVRFIIDSRKPLITAHTSAEARKNKKLILEK